MRQLKDLFDFFAGSLTGQPSSDAQHHLQLATAVLLTEVMRAEPEITSSERRATIAALKSRFALSLDEVNRLLELAEREAAGANDFFRFTSTINDHFLHAQKILIVEQMWCVAYADAHLGAHENHLISKVAGLLHVTHGEYISAKMRAKQAATPDS